MPSPLAHTLAGALISAGYVRGQRDPRQWFGLSWPWLLGVVAILSLLPDLPTVLGLFTGDLAPFHNRQEHSLSIGLLVACGVGLIASRATGTRFVPWFLLTLSCYWLHIAMDYLTIGRGVMALWPWTDSRFGSPVRIFYGLPWSEGWLSWRHLWTVFTEAVMVGGVAVLVFWRRRRGRASTRS